MAPSLALLVSRVPKVSASVSKGYVGAIAGVAVASSLADVILNQATFMGELSSASTLAGYVGVVAGVCVYAPVTSSVTVQLDSGVLSLATSDVTQNSGGGSAGVTAGVFLSGGTLFMNDASMSVVESTVQVSNADRTVAAAVAVSTASTVQARNLTGRVTSSSISLIAWQDAIALGVLALSTSTISVTESSFTATGSSLRAVADNLHAGVGAILGSRSTLIVNGTSVSIERSSFSASAQNSVAQGFLGALIYSGTPFTTTQGVSLQSRNSNVTAGQALSPSNAKSTTVGILISGTTAFLNNSVISLEGCNCTCWSAFACAVAGMVSQQGGSVPFELEVSGATFTSVSSILSSAPGTAAAILGVAAHLDILQQSVLLRATRLNISSIDSVITIQKPVVLAAVAGIATLALSSAAQCDSMTILVERGSVAATASTAIAVAGIVTYHEGTRTNLVSWVGGGSTLRGASVVVDTAGSCASVVGVAAPFLQVSLNGTQLSTLRIRSIR
jgi:hypothetical protein